MLVGNTIDEIASSWHGKVCPFDINTPINSSISGAARLDFIFNL
jgi:hypothetical protein